VEDAFKDAIVDLAILAGMIDLAFTAVEMEAAFQAARLEAEGRPLMWRRRSISAGGVRRGKKWRRKKCGGVRVRDILLDDFADGPLVEGAKRIK
jgi:hypothetical protein